MTRVRLDLSEGYMDVTLAPDADDETVDALRAVGEAGIRWLKANDVARAWAYGRARQGAPGSPSEPEGSEGRRASAATPGAIRKDALRSGSLGASGSAGRGDTP